MKIITCHIENFGKISDVTFDFSDGVNEIYAENGWGKSTLANFFKVMFYGFDNEGAKIETKNERKRYKPWQGGVYGGNVTFEAAGKCYRLTRLFGAKEKDDTFELKDANTNLESSDYSTNIGEELFGIDSESFARTVFIRDNDCVSGVSDSINAKLGNLVDNTDDINNFENVDAKLKDAINRLTPKSKKGALSQLKSEITALGTDVREGEIIDRNIGIQYENCGKAKDKVIELKEELAAISKELLKSGEYKDKKAAKDKYDLLVANYEKRKGICEEAGRFFHGQKPDMEDLDSKILESASLRESAGHIRSLEINYLESDNTDDNSIKLDELELKFSMGVPTNEEISDKMGQWGEYTDIQNQLIEKKMAFKMLEQEEERAANTRKERKTKKGRIMVTLGSLLLVCAIIIIAAGAVKIAGAMSFFAGVACIVIGISSFASAKNITPGSNPELENLKDEITYDEETMKQISDDIEDFFIRYNMLFDTHRINEELYNLRSLIAQYNNLKEISNKSKKEREDRKNKYLSEKQAYEGRVKKINEYLSELGFTLKEDINSQLVDIKEKLNLYINAANEYEESRISKESFEKEYPDYAGLKDLEPAADDVSIKAMEARRDEIIEYTEQLHNEINSYENRIQELSANREVVTEKEEMLERKQAEYDEGLKLYEELSLTRDLLAEAKVNLTNRYTKPVKDGFDKYYRKLSNEISRFSFDGNINLNVNEQGMDRNPDMLSHGYRDMAGICTRMALVDAMYKDEKPFVIFDDPFVNLDSNKVSLGSEMLTDIGRDYQVIYFTCHESRRTASA